MPGKEGEATAVYAVPALAVMPPGDRSMGWVKLDDAFFRNRKVRDAEPTAILLYLCAICYAGANLTDGRIRPDELPILAAEARLRRPEEAARQLVEIGLWEADGEGWRIHDYDAYQTPSAIVKE